MLLGAGLLYQRARSFADRKPVAAGYRTADRGGSSEGATLRGLSILLLLLFAISQLLYVWFYVELARWLAGSHEPPRIVFDLYAWVLLVCGTCLGASLYTAPPRRPR